MMHKRGVVATMVALRTAYLGFGARRALSPNPVPLPISFTFVPNDSICYANFFSFISYYSSFYFRALGVSDGEETLFFLLFSRIF